MRHRLTKLGLSLSLTYYVSHCLLCNLLQSLTVHVVPWIAAYNIAGILEFISYLLKNEEKKSVLMLDKHFIQIGSMVFVSQPRH